MFQALSLMNLLYAHKTNFIYCLFKSIFYIVEITFSFGTHVCVLFFSKKKILTLLTIVTFKSTWMCVLLILWLSLNNKNKPTCVNIAKSQKNELHTPYIFIKIK